MSKIETGCLAMIVGAIHPWAKPFIGTIHRVGQRCNVYSGCWDMDPPIYAKEGPEVSFGETHLRRIDNPGDDEADLLLAPLPKQDKVPA